MNVSNQEASPPESGVVTTNLKELTMRKVFAGLAVVLVLAVVIQFFFAASGAFDTAPNDEAFQPHRIMGYLILLLAVLMAIVGALARMPGRFIGMTGLVAGLVVVQVVIAVLAKAFNDTGDTSTTAGRLVFGLHAVNGLAIFHGAESIARQSRALSRSATTGVPSRSRVPGPAAGSAEPAS